MSPSTRRVWIEIGEFGIIGLPGTVTLHTEGVDRNAASGTVTPLAAMSPSTRRVWIEIRQAGGRWWLVACHPPHGGCG